MQYLIHGADQKTGREMTIVVDARDQAEAEQRVLYNDILIASMSRFISPPPQPTRVGPMAPYQRPEPAPEEREKRTRTPFYKEILAGARWLGGLAVAVRMVGVFTVLLALCATLLPVIKPVREIMPFRVIPLLWFIGGAMLLAMGFACMLCGATVSMMSGLALAVRDMARNSFEEDPPLAPQGAEAPRRMSISQVREDDLIDCPAEARQLPSA
ncbi:MAG TPA: hypothetical protein VGQ99_14940 [Tepidisphaeraceae bacterium]|jgi:hypothetical protein|nr:hypothetical protein [Tepidisphaeraceae bacterium]